MVFKKSGCFVMNYLEKSFAEYFESSGPTAKELKFVKISTIGLAKCLAYDYGMFWFANNPSQAILVPGRLGGKQAKVDLTFDDLLVDFDD